MTREETIKQLLDIKHLVDGALHALRNVAGAAAAAPSDKAYFDPTNPTHLAEVNKLFAQYQLNDRRRSWFLNRGLQGVRMFDLADVVDRETKKYELQYPRYTRQMAAASQQRRH
jgi:hypothetical protein